MSNRFLTNKGNLLLFLLFLLVMAGCKSSEKMETVQTGEIRSQQELLELIQEQSFPYKTLTARLNVDLNLPDNSFSSRVDLKMVKDSAFQLSVQPFLGIEMFRIELSTDSIKIMDRMNKRYMADNYANLKGQTPIEFNFYNLQALFTDQLFLPGQKGIAPKQYNRFKMKPEGPLAELKIKDAMNLVYTFMADGEGKLISTHISDPSDQYSLQWRYIDFRLAGDRFFPMKMDVQVRSDGTSKGGMTLFFSRIQTDNPVKLDFSIPSKYKRITLDQIIKSLASKKKQP